VALMLVIATAATNRTLAASCGGGAGRGRCRRHRHKSDGKWRRHNGRGARASGGGKQRRRRWWPEAPQRGTRQTEWTQASGARRGARRDVTVFYDVVSAMNKL